MADRLWDSKHPYYATTGCYYVGALGVQRGGSFDGNSCHVDFESWADFKTGRQRPYSESELAYRRQAGIDDTRIGAGDVGFHDADEDLNLLYRWDWHERKEDEEDDEHPHGPITLDLFYIFQRKARPHSVRITVTRDDEPEIRAWLLKKWHHLQRLWTPFAPDVPVEASGFERNERTAVHYAQIAEALRG